MNKSPFSFPELRRNPFTEGRDEIVAICPQRMQRPWEGQTADIEEEKHPLYDPTCPLCPSNTRQKGDKNPSYHSTFVFVNDNPAFVPDIPQRQPEQYGSDVEKIFFTRHTERGTCEVLCYSPDHNKTMMHMTLHEIETVIRLWKERYHELGQRSYINHVAIFETRGHELGSSQPHPHGQIWAQEHIPPLAAVELRKHTELSKQLGENAMLAYLREEIQKNERVIFKNNDFVLLIPFWAVWPYETMIIPTSEISSVKELREEQVSNLAQILSLTTNMYGTLFSRPLFGAPYMMGLHQLPTDEKEYPDFQMHFHFACPMLTPDRQKFPAGYEEFNGPQRDLTPEKAAETLKSIVSRLQNKTTTGRL